MSHFRAALTIVLSVVLGTFATGAQTKPVSVYVGPQVRDGFIDVDQGILDSIRDVTNELRKDKALRIVSKPEEAAVTLLILGRRAGPAGSSVAITSGGTTTQIGNVAIPAPTVTTQIPIEGRAIDALLRVSTYEKPLTADDRESGTWSRAAGILAKDVRVWITANRAKLTP
jgi:hypothetical protein